MRNPFRTLLYDLFAAPALRVLQAIVDWVGKAASAGMRIGRQTRTRIPWHVRSERMRDSRSHWEKLGIVVPVYQLAGEGLSDREIAVRLQVTENAVYGCIRHLLRILKCRTRAELVLYASPKPNQSWTLRNTPTELISGVRRWRQRRLADALLMM
jgi:hypothetical protein